MKLHKIVIYFRPLTIGSHCYKGERTFFQNGDSVGRTKSGIGLCSPRRPAWDRTEGGDRMTLTSLFQPVHSSPGPHLNVPEAKGQGSLNLTWCMRVCIESDLSMLGGEKCEHQHP